MGTGSRSKTTTLANSVGGIATRAPALPVGIAFLAVLFVLVVAAVVYGWRQWGKTVVARPVYRIAIENIRVTPPPPWIRSDLRAEVVRDAALQDLTIFDKDVTIRVYQAFELHPWVAKVKRVSKHPPARLDVDLDFRKPVAWVEVPRGVLPGNEGGVIPVDGDAVVLPSRDFTQEHVGDYLRISVPGLSPCGLAGTPWGDPRVAGAARLAQLLEDSWREWKLFRIWLVTAPEITRRSELPVYEIETLERRRIIWGHAPGSEPSQEPSPLAKLARLRQLMESQAQLGPGNWDLRSAEPVR